MKAPSEALILEDDADHMEDVVAAMRALSLEPLPTQSPDQALRRLAYYRPVLAVIDLDLSKAPPSKQTVEDVLVKLYESFGGCLVLVYSIRADEIMERKRIEQLHPLALFVSKQDGEGALIDRIRRLIGVRFGDLIVRRGLTYHELTGTTFAHSVGVSLMLGAATGQEVILDDTDAKAARRMRRWLAGVGSPVQILDLGRRHYALHVDEQ